MEQGETSNCPYLPLHHELVGLWRQLLGAEVCRLNQSFLELRGSTQLARAMLKQVEEQFGKRVCLAEFLRDPTIKGLAGILLREADTRSLFVPIREGKNRVPFYFFHGDILGAGYYSKRLADLLGPEQPFHISPPIELGDDELPSVEQLAARKRCALQQRQPHGPYLLGGFCVGAVVAYEMARQLEAVGEQVPMVLLIEPEIGDFLTRSHLRLVEQVALRRPARDKVEVFMRGMKKIERLRHVWRSPWPEKKAFALNNTMKLLRRNRAAGNHGGDEDLSHARSNSVMSEYDYRLDAYHWVLTSYVPKPYQGPVTMLLTDDQFHQTPFILKQWQKAAPHVRVERIPGDHMTCITTHLHEVAGKIRSEIEAVKSLAMMLMPAAWPLAAFD